MSAERETGEAISLQERAAQWCVRLSTGTLSSTERAAFDKWMAADPANATAFAQAFGVWSSLHAIADAPQIIERRADALRALRRGARVGDPGRASHTWRWTIGIAASLFLIVVTSIWMLGSDPHVYSTGLGERRALLLADGSRLSLDAETKVAVTYSRDHRDLRLLSGRAKFEVAEDRTRPFTVRAGDRTVIATGTAFSVEILRDQVHVIVYEGRVAILSGPSRAPEQLLRIKEHPGKHALALAPGSELVADLAPDAPARIVPADVTRSLFWEGGQLNFVDEPIVAAAERLNRYSREKIVVGDSATGEIKINGVFNAGDSAAFVSAVSESYPVRVSRVGDNFILTRAQG